MKHKAPNLGVSLPKCRHCGRYWQPPEGVVADAAYCEKCAVERRSTAATALGLRPMTVAEGAGPYLVPRRLRAS